jgi:hypothetical protein
MYHPPAVTLTVECEDSPDVLRIEARAVSGEWSGVTRIYVSASVWLDEAQALLGWMSGPDDAFLLESGGDPDISSMQMHLRRIDHLGHYSCRVCLVGWEPDASRIELNLSTDTSALERFGRHLFAMAQARAGEAVLAAT